MGPLLLLFAGVVLAIGLECELDADRWELKLGDFCLPTSGLNPALDGGVDVHVLLLTRFPTDEARGDAIVFKIQVIPLPLSFVVVSVDASHQMLFIEKTLSVLLCRAVLPYEPTEVYAPCVTEEFLFQLYQRFQKYLVGATGEQLWTMAFLPFPRASVS